LLPFVQETQATLQALSRPLQQQQAPGHPQQQQQQPDLTAQQQLQSDCLSTAPVESVQRALQQLLVVLADELQLGLQPVQQQHWQAQAGATAAAAAEDEDTVVDLALAAYFDALLQQVCVAAQ
jgi:hypothetical protein